MTGTVDQPLVSVVVVNYNGMRWLDRCLRTLSRQDYPATEVLLIDNASSDDSLDFVATNFPAVTIIRNATNRGFAGGVNVGIAAARGEFVMLFNTDAWCDSSLVTQLVAGRSHLGVDVVAAHESSYDGTVHPATLFLIDPLGHSYVRPRYLGDKHDFYLSGACLLFSPKLYVSTGGLDENFFMYCEEVDWFWRLRLLGRSFAYVEGAYVFHAGRDLPARLRPDVFRWRNQNTLQMLLKNYSGAGLAVALPLFVAQSLFEFLSFLVLRRSEIAWTYPQALSWNIRHLSRTLRQRRSVQDRRVRGDWDVLNGMYWGSAKAGQALSYVKTRG